MLLTISGALGTGRSPLQSDLAEPSDLKEVRLQILLKKKWVQDLEVCNLGPEAMTRPWAVTGSQQCDQELSLLPICSSSTD